MNKNEPHFACACCGSERTFPADHLRAHGGELWCSDCWDRYSTSAETGLEFIDLPQFVPEADLKIQALTEGLQAIKQHLDLMGVGNLSTVWNIADAALKKAEAIGK